MKARAVAKYLPGSPQKARLVVDTIRGKRVPDALAILRFTNKRAASHIEKCLRSAIANATEKAERQNVAVDPDDLFVKTAFVDMGPTKHRRRVRPAPQGRAYREQRHFCHVTVLVSSDGREAAPATSGVTVPTFGLGIRPRGPRICPRPPTTRMASGAAITMSKSSLPALPVAVFASSPEATMTVTWQKWRCSR